MNFLLKEFKKVEIDFSLATTEEILKELGKRKEKKRNRLFW